MKLYIKESYNELVHKVTWPKWEALQESTIVVLIASLLIALVVLGMDMVSDNILKVVYQIIVG
ncbi:MAG: preprotein translocase subunit SecE [Chitinophagaceae bacterium]|nr:MAG: preprotein translocase subunit SecE [Chitinophagaceae bacterium]